MNSNRIFSNNLNQYSPRLDYFLKTLGISRPEDREDLVQDILAKAVRSQESYHGGFAFSTWLYTIARRTAVDFLRKKQPVPVSYEDDYPSAFLKPEECLLREEERLFIRDFLSSLKSEQRQIAYLRYFENFPLKKIALVLGLPEGTVKYHLFEIKRQLKEAWKLYETS